MRTIEWRGDHAVLIDQTRLPHEVAHLEVHDVDAMVDAIRRLAVRGAPALGAAGGFGVAIAALRAEQDGLPSSTHAKARGRAGGRRRASSPSTQG